MYCLIVAVVDMFSDSCRGPSTAVSMGHKANLKKNMWLSVMCKTAHAEPCGVVWANETPNTKTLLKPRQVTAIQERLPALTLTQTCHTHARKANNSLLPESLHTHWLLSSCNNLSVPPVPFADCHCLSFFPPILCWIFSLFFYHSHLSKPLSPILQSFAMLCSSIIFFPHASPPFCSFQFSSPWLYL